MTAKISGRNQIMYIDGNSVVRLKNVDINADNPGIDIEDDISSDYGEVAPGVVRFNGTLTANYDDAQTEIWDALVAIGLKDFYIYPTSAAPTKYVYGSGLFSWSRTQPHDGTVGLSGSFKVNGALSRN